MLHVVHRKVTPSIKFASTHLYTWVERGTVRVKGQEQNANNVPSQSSNPNRSLRSELPPDERSNHEATLMQKSRGGGLPEELAAVSGSLRYLWPDQKFETFF